MLISVQVKDIQNLVLYCQLLPAFSVITVLLRPPAYESNDYSLPSCSLPLYFFRTFIPVLSYGKVIIH